MTHDGYLTLTVPTAALKDLLGIGNLAFSGTYAVDITSQAYPTPLTGKLPAGSLIYDPSVSGSVGFVGDTDAYTLSLAANQTITLVLSVDPGLIGTLALAGPGGPIASVVGSGPGNTVVLETSPVATAGTYSLVVGGSGGTTGGYTLQAILNAAYTQPSDGINSIGSAYDLSSAFVGLGTTPYADRAGVVGTVAPTGTQVYSANFEGDGSGSLDGFTIDNYNGGLWHLSQGRGNQPGHSDTYSLYMGQGEDINGGGNYNTFNTVAGNLTSPWISLPAGGGLSLNFNYVLQTEGSTFWDQSYLQISTDGSNFNTIRQYNGLAESSVWTGSTVDLSAYAGQNVELRWHFDTLDPFANSYEGWYVDDVSIMQTAFQNDYAVSLAAGQSATAVVKGMDSTAQVELLDSAGNIVAMGQPGGGVDSAISNFVAPTSGIYYVQVTASVTTAYDLVVTRGADFSLHGKYIRQGPAARRHGGRPGRDHQELGGPLCPR